MYKNRSQGFTLIELLVVIGIIGILSAVVLASLNTARSKGSDAAIQSNLDTIRTQAEIYYGGTGANTYGTLAWTTGSACYPAAGTHMFSTAGDPTIQKAMSGTDSANGTGSIGCVAAGSSYVVAAALVGTPSAAYWCVDSSGTSKQVNGAFPVVAISVCP